MSDPDWISGDPGELRRWRDRQLEVVAPVLPSDVAISAVEPDASSPGGLLFEPDGAPSSEFIYFHGGGFVVGSPETHRIVAAWIAHLAPARVMSVRYRLAPEFPLPAQAEDAVAAIRWRLGKVPRLRLAGDSAGALVALWAYAALRPEEREWIDGALLIYGAYGLVADPEPDDEALEVLGLGPRSLAATWARVDPLRQMPGNPRLCPLVPGFPLPRMALLAAREDPVLRDSLALATSARKTGTDVHVVVAEGQPHGFLSNLPAPEALQPLAESLRWLNA